MPSHVHLLLCLFYSVGAFYPFLQTIHIDLNSHFHAELKSNDIFNGHVEIFGQKLKTGNVIVLNAWRIDVFAANVTCNNQHMETTSVEHKKLLDDTVKIELKENITEGSKCLIKMKYAAPFSDLYGLYKSYYPSKYEETNRAVSIVTNNEPEMNRLWAPCIDSMDVLANWTIIIDHPLHTRVLGMATAHTRRKDKHQHSHVKSKGPWQASKVAFAVIEEKRFKTYSVQTDTNQTLRFWFPRNITFRMKANDILKISSEHFSDLSGTFGHVLRCRLIEFVVLQHRNGLSSGCLVILDQRHDLNVQQLRTSIAKLWLGSEVLYSSTQNAWFTHSIAQYLGMSYQNWTEVDRLKLLKDTVEHPGILGEPLVSKYGKSWASRELYPNKGAFVISMIAEIIGPASFKEMLKELVRRFHGKFLTDDRVFFLTREFTERSRWPSCYRAFLGTQTDFVGFPVVKVNRGNDTLILSQHNFAVTWDDYRYKQWFFTSQWTNPIWISTNESTEFMWLHHDDKEIQLELLDSDSMFVDRETRGLYLVEYSGKDLFVMWNNTQDCSYFHRYCLEPTINRDFCSSIYEQQCSLHFPLIPLIYSGYSHRWDRDELNR